MRNLKSLIALGLALCLLTACGQQGQASSTEPSSLPLPESPSSVSEPETSSSEPESAPESSSEPESTPESAPEPDGLPVSPQGETNPDFGMGNPSADPVNPDNDGTLGTLLKKEQTVKNAVDVFFLNAPADAYSYQRVELANDQKIKLEVGVIDEAAIDQFLAGYTGEPWDELVKTPGVYSVTKREEFVKAVRQLEPEPGVHLDAYSLDSFGEERFTIDVYFDKPLTTPEEAEHWAQPPQALKDLAEKMGVSEEALDYMSPRYTPSGNHPD